MASLGNNTQVLFFGATGYVGGTVLARLLKHPAVEGRLTVFVRSEQKAEVLRERFKCKAVVGAYDDADQLKQLASQADVVFSCAELSDNPPGMRAILQGLKEKHISDGTVPHLIHTSGTGVLASDDRGMRFPDMIYDDSDLSPMDEIPPDALHRPVELMVMDADTEGYVRTYIVSPGTVWGIVSGPLVETGIQKSQSHQIPALIRASLDRKRAGMVGRGLARKPNVNVQELADLFVVLFDAVTNNLGDTRHGREGYIFAENGEHSWYDISKEISRVLFSLGISESDEPSSFTADELVKYWGSETAGYGFGASSRCRASRARKLGWKPTKSTGSMLKSVQEEVYVLTRK